MFKSKKTKLDPNMTDTLIGEGTHFEGRLKSEASIRIEGHIVGDIDSLGDVTVGENGEARSNINARHVILAGQVTGNVQATGKLTIKATGKLHGNLSAMELAIEPGGVFLGTSSKLAQETQPEEEAKLASIDDSGAANASPAPSPDQNAAKLDESTATVLRSW